MENVRIFWHQASGGRAAWRSPMVQETAEFRLREQIDACPGGDDRIGRIAEPLEPADQAEPW